MIPYLGIDDDVGEKRTERGRNGCGDDEKRGRVISKGRGEKKG